MNRCFLKNCSDIINEYFQNSPSKQMNLFDYFIIFFNGKKIIGKNENVNFENVNFVNN